MIVGREWPIAVYRYIPPVSGWGEEVRTYMFTFNATIQPFTADDGLHNEQMMQNVRYMLDVVNPDLAIKYNDELVFWTDVIQRVANIQRHKSGIIDHMEIFTSDKQVGL